LNGSDAITPDPAIVGGLAKIFGTNVMVIGHAKGTPQRRGGSPMASGYKKALDLMKKAENMRIPLITLIDTPGAFIDEEGLQANTISRNIYEMIKLKIPSISIVIGEGGSGGALGIGATDKILMLKNSYYSPISVEGACSILKLDKNKPADFEKAATSLKFTSYDNLKNNIVDGIIDEPKRGAQSDRKSMYKKFTDAVFSELRILQKTFNEKNAIETRLNKYRGTARFKELSKSEYTNFLSETKEPVAEMKTKLTFVKCENSETHNCQDISEKLLFEKYQGICKNCNHHFPIPPEKSLDYYLWLLVDHEKNELLFKETNENIKSINPINFAELSEKIEKEARNTGKLSALVTGFAKIDGHDCVLAISNYGLRRGTLGGAEGEKFVRATEECIKNNIPLVAVHQTGGVRINEGMHGLMQMVATDAALCQMKEKQIPFISVYLNPTTAGVLASYASMAEFIIAEKNAQVGFAGLKVIESTIGKTLSKDYLSAEKALERGGVSIVSSRDRLKHNVARLLDYYGK
jgi:acetyl-CoA carboxylase carboxyl transferase beta subunit/acetyl-CoA carboxylase carboxyl transferase alpha subunit